VGIFAPGRFIFLFVGLILTRSALPAKELVILDNDWNIPGSYIAQTAIVPLLASPNITLLGLTSVTGDCWRDEGTVNLLRYLELIGAPEVPVANGAVFPLVNTQARMAAWEAAHGFIFWKGAWNDPARRAASHPLDPYKVVTPPEGLPRIKPIAEGAAAFMIRQVHAHPHEVTIFAAGPLTNLAVAISLDPEFAGLAKRLVLQGGRVLEDAAGDGFHSDFNIIFDPEAAHITLAAPWPEILSCADVSDRFKLDRALLDRLKAHATPAIEYLARNSTLGLGLWDEMGSMLLADPSLIQRSLKVQMDVDIDHGASYGRTIVAAAGNRPRIGVTDVILVQAVDGRRFMDEYVADLQTDLRMPKTIAPKPSPDDPACTAQDRKFMARAYELARYATTHGGGPFGALLVKEGRIIAEYSNCVKSTKDVTKHAETGLIAAFSPKLDRATFEQSTLYTSTEPCAMCCGAVMFAGIGRMVYGTSEAPFLQTMGLPPDPQPLTSHELLHRIAPRVKVAGPLMEAEGLVIHEAYWPAHPEDVGKL
jgi:inosine-uridine nucleoside N-ribohydrolase/tRNA(Arg) A34 adenosine deaminase TadA